MANASSNVNVLVITDSYNRTDDPRLTRDCFPRSRGCSAPCVVTTRNHFCTTPELRMPCVPVPARGWANGRTHSCGTSVSCNWIRPRTNGFNARSAASDSCV